MLLFLLFIVSIFSVGWYVKEYYRRSNSYVVQLPQKDLEWNKNRRVIVIGYTCSGKSTFSKFLSTHLGVERIELDEIHWKENWKSNKNVKEDFEKRMEPLVVDDDIGWVVDGNYHRSVGFDHYQHSDTVIFLNIPPLINWMRLIYRTVVERLIFRRKCCGNNYESFWTQFTTKNSLFYWFYTRKDKSRYASSKFYKKKKLSHLNVYAPSSPYEVKLLQNEILRSIKKSTTKNQ